MNSPLISSPVRGKMVEKGKRWQFFRLHHKSKSKEKTNLTVLHFCGALTFLTASQPADMHVCASMFVRALTVHSLVSYTNLNSITTKGQTSSQPNRVLTLTLNPNLHLKQPFGGMRTGQIFFILKFKAVLTKIAV